jgi:hypothetical protein
MSLQLGRALFADDWLMANAGKQQGHSVVEAICYRA